MRSQILSAIRHLNRWRGYSLLNIAGLSVGLASSALILMYVQYEMSYDTFHANADRVYRVYKRDPGNMFMGTDFFAVVPAPLGPAMKEEFPEVESFARFTYLGSSALVRTEKATLLEVGVTYAEPSIFSIFDIPLISGDPSTALVEPNTAVISEEIARKHFGSEDPIGKTIQVRDRYTLRITGVMKDPPKNTHVRASIYISFATYEAERGREMNWGNSSYQTFVLLKQGADPRAVEGKFPAFVQTHMAALFKEWGQPDPTEFFLQPLTDMHLGSTHINFEGGDTGDRRTIAVLTALAIVLLATASINYMNLATARASLRSREVGIRKVIGAGRGELIGQFLGESLLTSLLAGAVALLIVSLVLPSFATFVGRALPSTPFAFSSFIPGFLLITVVVGILSGSYPAFVLSTFSPSGVLRGGTKGSTRSRLRDTLVVLQFAAAVGLAVCAFSILSQLNFIKSTDPGFDRDQVLSVRIRGPQVVQKLGTYRDRIAGLSSVLGSGVSTHLPIEVGSSGSVTMRSEKGEEVETQVYQLYTDDRFPQVYKLQMVKGRYFQGEPLPPDQEPTEFVVNETFARTFGINDPIGAQFKRDGRTVTIIGVVKDFHLHSFRHPIEPLMMAQHSTDWVSYLSIRIRPENMTSALADLQNAWKTTMTDQPFDYGFVDEGFDRLYEHDEKLGEIVLSFTTLALFVGAMGLLGLATFIAELRRKEIGIRKVLGASSASISALLSRQFLVLVGIANLIAWPAAYYIMNEWLSGFAYRIKLGPSTFIAAGITAALIALVAVSIHTIRAGRANPVESLRYE